MIELGNLSIVDVHGCSPSFFRPQEIETKCVKERPDTDGRLGYCNRELGVDAILGNSPKVRIDVHPVFHVVRICALDVDVVELG